MQIRVRGRSFMAFVLLPQPPLADWLAALRVQCARAPGFFAGRPVILDCSLLAETTEGLASLLPEIAALGIAVVQVENVSAVPGLWPGSPALAGGRTGAPIEIKPHDPARPEAAAPPPDPRPQPGLIVEDHVRSGQLIHYPRGDVTILGSVSSGAEILAGGSIHIYGALRGRALAGAQGFAKARIFCNRLEAELLSIDGFYRTAEDIDPALHGTAAQVWLDSGHIMIAGQR